jgi:proteasome-associated ATPase
MALDDDPDGPAGGDAGDTEAERLRRRLSEQNQEISELEAELQAYEEKLEEIQEPPLLSAYILRTTGDDLGDDEVVVCHGNQVLKVTSGAVEKPDLKQGQYVWLHPKTYAVLGSSSLYEEGVVGKVTDILGDKIAITLGGGRQEEIVDADPGLIEEIQVGYEVTVLPPSNEIMEVRPASEIRELFLGETPDVGYDDVGGLDEIMERIRDVVELPYREPELFESIDLEAPKGVLMYGPPGCGKTLIGKAVAAENDMTFFDVRVADILSKWVGESESMIKSVFRKAREKAPSVIFFDEFDALATTRGQQDTAGVHKNIIAQILSEMDGLEALRDVYIMGATNRPDMVDPALLRPGRFDEVIEIPRPEEEAARQILDIYLTPDLPIDQDYVERIGNHEKAHKALMDRVIEELYGEDKWVEFKLDSEAQEAVKTIKRKDVVSGALIDSIVRTAKKNYVKRAMQSDKDSKERERSGLTEQDLVEAIQEESKEHALVESSVYQRRQREREGFEESEGVEVI